MDNDKDKLFFNASGLSLLCKSIIHASECNKKGEVKPELSAKAKKVLDSLLSVRNPNKTLQDEFLTELPEQACAGLIGKYVAEVYFQISRNHQRDILHGLRGLFEKISRSTKNNQEPWFSAEEISHHFFSFGRSGKGKSFVSLALSPLYTLTNEFLKSSYGLSFNPSSDVSSSLPFEKISSEQGKELIYALLTLNEDDVNHDLCMESDIISLAMKISANDSTITSYNSIKEVLLLRYKDDLRSIFSDPNFMQVIGHLYGVKFESDMISGVTYEDTKKAKLGHENSDGMVFLGIRNTESMLDILSSKLKCHQLIPAYCSIYKNILSKADGETQNANLLKRRKIVTDVIISSLESFLSVSVTVTEGLNGDIDRYEKVLLNAGVLSFLLSPPIVGWCERLRRLFHTLSFSIPDSSDESDIISEEAPLKYLLKVVITYKSSGLSVIQRDSDLVYLALLGRVTFTEALSKEISDNTKSLLLKSIS